jgi:hypothetical protein
MDTLQASSPLEDRAKVARVEALIAGNLAADFLGVQIRDALDGVGREMTSGDSGLSSYEGLRANFSTVAEAITAATAILQTVSPRADRAFDLLEDELRASEDWDKVNEEYGYNAFFASLEGLCQVLHGFVGGDSLP